MSTPVVVLLLLVCSLVWGSTWTAIRYQLGAVDPTWSLAYRFAIAALTMAALAQAYRAPIRIRRDDLPLVCAIAVMQFLLNFLCIYAAETYIISGLVAMIFALLIAPNAVLGWIFLRQRVGLAFALGTLLAMAGMALLFAPQLRAVGGDADRIAIGIGLSLGGMLSASIGNLLQATQRARRMHWATLLLWSIGLAALFNALIALAVIGPPQIDPRPAYWMATVYLGMVGTALTFPVYLTVMRVIGPARAAYSGIIIPIVALGFSTLLEGYRWTPEAVAGSVLAVAGLVVALRTRSPAR